jgi:hypothetical protein
MRAVYAEIQNVLRRLLEDTAPPGRLPPVKPDPRLEVPTLSAVFRTRNDDPKLVRHYKDRIAAHPSFRSEPVLHMIIDLAWMLYALDRFDEAVAVVEEVIEYHRDNDEFIFNTQEGMQVVKLAALLRTHLGGERLEQYRDILDKLEAITQQVRERNKHIDRGAPDPRQASRRVLEDVVPKGLARARAESRRVMAFALLRTSLDKVATALVREAYAGLPATQVRAYLDDGLAQYRHRIEKGK